jgi:hypothetical protein
MEGENYYESKKHALHLEKLNVIKSSLLTAELAKKIMDGLN